MTMLPTAIDETSFELVSFNPANPVAAAPYIFVVPSHTVILPLAATFRFTTDANASNRRIYITGGPPAIQWSHVHSADNHVANVVINYHFTPNMSASFYSAAQNLAQYTFAPELYLYPTDYFVIGFLNGQIGDQLSHIYFGYKRWILQ